MKKVFKKFMHVQGMECLKACRLRKGKVIFMIQEGVLFGFLTVCSLQDMKEKKVKLGVLFWFAILGLVIHLTTFQQSLSEMAGGMLVGGFVLLLSFLTRESIGKGDGLLLMVTGLYLGMRQNMLLLLIGIFLAGICALFLFVFGKKRKKDDIPFIPFLFASYLCMLGMQYGKVWV